MALRATSYWRSALTRLGSNRSFATTSSQADSQQARSGMIRGEHAPVYIVMGFVLMALTIGTHTAKQQLLHAPAVNFNKKRRETVAEVEEPQKVEESANKFLSKSFLRKVAHIQDDTRTIPDPIKRQ